MFIKGMDISTLVEQEKLGAKYYGFDGQPVDVVRFMKSMGTNSVRIRLWNNPYDVDGNPYGAGTCDLGVVTELFGRAKENGMHLLLDFHYSDFWADPGKQFLPKAWSKYSALELERAVYDFTVSTIRHLGKLDLLPDSVQVGNEITNGMLWPYGKLIPDEKTGKNQNFEQLSRFIKAGVKAVRETCDAKIMLHLERSYDNESYREWFDYMTQAGVDFDIIGASYYPTWHRNMRDLESNLTDMALRYGKEIIVVETGYAFTLEHFDKSRNNQCLVVGPQCDKQWFEFEVSQEGQSQYMTALMNMIKRLPNGLGKGFYYWEPAWTPVEGGTWATESARIYTGEQDKTGGNEWANQVLFDYDGKALKAWKTVKDFE